MKWEFNNEKFQEASLYLADDPVEDLVKRVEESTGAGRLEVLLAILFEIEELVHQHGVPGPDFLAGAAINRREFRGDVKAAKEMRAALDEILRQHRSKDKEDD